MRLKKVFWHAGAFAAVIIGSASIALGDPYTKGNVFVSTGVGTVQERTPTGTLVQTLTGGSSFMTGSAFDAAGNFYVTNFGANTVRKYDSNGTFVGLFGGGYSTPEMIVFDASGNAYVGSIGGGIRKFNSAGNFLSSSITSTRVDFMDLAADQVTMLFGQEGGQILRANVATNTLLSPFSTSVDNAFALRILSNGSVLVADGSDIELLSPSGTDIRTYDIAGAGTWFGLNLDVDGTSFWSATTDGLIARFDIATGAALGSFNVTGTNGTWGLAVFGERTVGGGGGNGQIPEPSSFLLLGAGLVSVALFIRKSRRNEWWKRVCLLKQEQEAEEGVGRL